MSPTMLNVCVYIKPWLGELLLLQLTPSMSIKYDWCNGLTIEKAIKDKD